MILLRTIPDIIGIVGILFVAGTIQRIVFLESQTPKQQIVQLKLVGSCTLGLYFMLCLIGMKAVPLWFSILGIILFVVIPFFYTSYCGRKKHKWLGLFEGIPLIGYVDGIWCVIDLLVDRISNETIRYIVDCCIPYAILLLIGIILWKNPRFTKVMKNSIQNRSLSAIEEIIIWAVGIWLFVYDLIIRVYFEENAASLMLDYISVLNFITAGVIVMYVFDSNYRNNYINQNNKLQKSLVSALAYIIDSKDRYTSGHSIRVAKYSVELAKRMGKSEEEQKIIYYAGLLHDVGKIRVPGSVINKPGKLTDEEFDQIKIHPVSGYHTLKDIYDDKRVALGAKYHHERYDGKGYPNNLTGENIPEIARIIGVADSYDAMASDRSYREALPQEVVRSEIEKGRGTQFDPFIADIMLRMIDEDANYEMRQTEVVYKDVLVIDDEPMNIKMVEFILKDEPVNVLSANSGEEGLKILSEQAVDLVLLDIVMPNMDGFEVFEKLREITNVPVVFMTTDKNLDSIKKSAEMGIEDYVTKPFLPLVLKETVHGIVNRWD